MTATRGELVCVSRLASGRDSPVRAGVILSSCNTVQQAYAYGFCLHFPHISDDLWPPGHQQAPVHDIEIMWIMRGMAEQHQPLCASPRASRTLPRAASQRKHNGAPEQEGGSTTMGGLGWGSTTQVLYLVRKFRELPPRPLTARCSLEAP